MIVVGTGNVRMSDMTPTTIEDYYGELTTTGGEMDYCLLERYHYDTEVFERIEGVIPDTLKRQNHEWNNFNGKNASQRRSNNRGILRNAHFTQRKILGKRTGRQRWKFHQAQEGKKNNK